MPSFVDLIKKYVAYILVGAGCLFLVAVVYFWVKPKFFPPPDLPPVIKPEVQVALKPDVDYLVCIFNQKECVYSNLGDTKELLLRKCGGRDQCEK